MFKIGNRKLLTKFQASRRQSQSRREEEALDWKIYF